MLFWHQHHQFWWIKMVIFRVKFINLSKIFPFFNFRRLTILKHCAQVTSNILIESFQPISMHSFCLREENCLPTPVLLHILTMGHSLGLYKWRESIKTLFQHCFSANLCPFRETPITPTPPSLLLKLNCDVPFWYGRDHIFPRWWGRKMNGDEIPPGDIHKPRGQLRGRGLAKWPFYYISLI